jgi:multiple sugar transport system permease protein
MGLGLLIALLLNNQIRARGFFRTLFYLPVVTPLVIAAIIWKWVYNGDFGLLNYYLIQLGIIHEPLLWLADPNLAMPAVIITSVWKSVGFSMVVYLAGLQSIPEDYYDAAKVDGASIWRRFRDITLPLLTPTLFFLLITQFIASFQVFGIIYVMTRGGPANATSVYIYNLYQNAFAFGKLGYASAMAWILFVLLATFTLIQWKLQKRWVFYE